MIPHTVGAGTANCTAAVAAVVVGGIVCCMLADCNTGFWQDQIPRGPSPYKEGNVTLSNIVSVISKVLDISY